MVAVRLWTPFVEFGRYKARATGNRRNINDCVEKVLAGGVLYARQIESPVELCHVSILE